MKCADGRTPLHYVALQNSKEVVELLLKKGADPDLEAQQNKMTPLQCAVLHDNREVAGLLMGKGPDPNVKGTDR